MLRRPQDDRKKKAREPLLFRGAHEQNRHIRPMAHLGDRAAVKQILQKTMAMRRHRDQIAVVVLGRLEDFIRRVAACQADVYLQSLGAQ